MNYYSKKEEQIIHDAISLNSALNELAAHIKEEVSYTPTALAKPHNRAITLFEYAMEKVKEKFAITEKDCKMYVKEFSMELNGRIR